MKARCVECGSQSFEKFSGEITCRNCGLVAEENTIQNNPFISQEIRSRASNPNLSIARTMGVDGRFIRKGWIYSSQEKSLEKAFIELRTISDGLQVTNNILKEAKELFKEISMRNLVVGRNKELILHSCIYMACAIHNIPKTALEITAFTHLNKYDLLRSIKSLKNELNVVLKPIEPLDLVPRYASRLQLSPETTTKAIEIASQIQEENLLSGKKPETILATSLYKACQETKEYRTQRQIANTIGVRETTIRNGVKIISK